MPRGTWHLADAYACLLAREHVRVCVCECVQACFLRTGVRRVRACVCQHILSSACAVEHVRCGAMRFLSLDALRACVHAYAVMCGRVLCDSVCTMYAFVRCIALRYVKCVSAFMRRCAYAREYVMCAVVRLYICALVALHCIAGTKHVLGLADRSKGASVQPNVCRHWQMHFPLFRRAMV